jgi:hypothetical protein
MFDGKRPSGYNILGTLSIKNQTPISSGKGFHISSANSDLSLSAFLLGVEVFSMWSAQ